jgi:hypothetical protein
LTGCVSIKNWQDWDFDKQYITALSFKNNAATKILLDGTDDIFHYIEIAFKLEQEKRDNYLKKFFKILK